MVDCCITIVFIDVDNNGYLDEHDFACLALRATIIEGKGEFSYSRLQEYQHIMLSLWEEIAELADFNKVCFSTTKTNTNSTHKDTQRFVVLSLAYGRTCCRMAG